MANLPSCKQMLLYSQSREINLLVLSVAEGLVRGLVAWFCSCTGVIAGG